ncbi:hypothetical protein BH09VER1_BH09VER1_27960 [soil metagenome]
MPPNEEQFFGEWTNDEAGLPCFDLRLADGVSADAPFRHLISTGHVSALADRWGNVNLFTTEEGFRWFNSPENCGARSSLGLVARWEGELYSLFYSELALQTGIRVGVGYVVYTGEAHIGTARFQLEQRVFAAPNRGKSLGAQFRLTRIDEGAAMSLQLVMRSDVTLWEKGITVFHGQDGCALLRNERDPLGPVFLRGEEGWEASIFDSSVRLSRDFTVEGLSTILMGCSIGYGEIPLTPSSFKEAQGQWRTRLAPYRAKAPEPWMEQECWWNAGQLLSFCSYDSSVGEYYISLGGYGWAGFSVREASETSMILSACDWELAAASLRFVAKTQLASGDVPKFHTMRRDRVSEEFDSDNELWFVLGCVESVGGARREVFLDEQCSYWDGGTDTIWEHLRRAFYWVRDEIGRGSHGLILIRQGDWNDYLSLMGRAGKGESVMNSGIACRAFDGLARLARKRGEDRFAREIELYVKEVRAAVDNAFFQGWFLRGYTDAGRPVGSRGQNRLFINAQTWPVLGGCGTPAERRAALQNAVEKCHTSIGLTLMSRPFSSPAPDDISGCAIPAGEGENAGIWPQTIYWLVWALAQEGMVDDALQEWTCGTLRNHARHFPEVPYGIFNGPDCYSSHWAGGREGWTQVQLLDRAKFAPMNPAIAWQGFAMRKINEASLHSVPEVEEAAASAGGMAHSSAASGPDMA